MKHAVITGPTGAIGMALIQELVTTAETVPAERSVKPDVKEVAGLE